MVPELIDGVMNGRDALKKNVIVAHRAKYRNVLSHEQLKRYIQNTHILT